MTPLSMNGHKRAILYARVSTDDQADKGYSLPSQLELCRKYVERLGYEVVAELTEDYSGATPIAERPEGKKLATMLKAREADALIVFQVDRLSRKLGDLVTMVEKWLQGGIEVHACDIGKIESENDIVLVIRGWQGTDERKKIVERTTRGRNCKAQAGKVVGQGDAPYGYCYSSGYFEIVEAEARVIKFIYVWYIRGDEIGKPLTFRGIARKLSEMGIPTPGTNGGRGTPRVRESNMWNPSTVSRILANETYAGVWRFGKQIGKNGKDGWRPVNEQIAVSVPTIVDREIWEQAQARRDYNKRMAKRNAKREYLLRGIGRCGRCGGALTGAGTYTRGQHYFYRCGRNNNRFPGLEEKCSQKKVRGDYLEAFVWQYFLCVMSDAVGFEKALREAQEAEWDVLQPLQDQLIAVLQAITETEKEAAEIAQALKRATRGGAVEKNLQAEMERVEKLYTSQIRERDELKGAIESEPMTDQDIETTLQFREDAIMGLLNPTFEEKRRYLEILNAEVTVRDTAASITCLLPGSDASRVLLRCGFQKA